MRKGFTLWFTGLSGAGKTTLTLLLEEELKKRGYPVQILDGDLVRQSLNRDVGFTQEDRHKNLERVSFVSKLLNDHGIIVLAAFISPYQQTRTLCKEQIKNFVEIYVKCSIQECIRRDVKGLYKKAILGEIKNFTGISDPYEEPDSPDVTVNTNEETPSSCLHKILTWLEVHSYISPIDTETIPISIPRRLYYYFENLGKKDGVSPENLIIKILKEHVSKLISPK